jgi:hypothetical protein
MKALKTMLTISLGLGMTWMAWQVAPAQTSGMAFTIRRAMGTDGDFQSYPTPEIERTHLSFQFKDSDLSPGTTYRYQVEVTDEDGQRLLFKTEAVSTPATALTLYQNHPNPFNPETTIRFLLPQKAHTNLSIFDARGRLVITLVDGLLGDGLKSYPWNGKNSKGQSVGSGVYFYRLRTGDKTLTRKMLLIK